MTPERIAASHLAAHTTPDIVALFERTDRPEHSSPEVRGWIMDELERRDPAAFDLWVASGEDSPAEFFSEPAR